MALVLVGATIPLTVIEVASIIMVLGIHIEFVTVERGGRLVTSLVAPLSVLLVVVVTAGRVVMSGAKVVLLATDVLFETIGGGLGSTVAGVVVVVGIDVVSRVGTLVKVSAGGNVVVVLLEIGRFEMGGRLVTGGLLMTGGGVDVVLELGSGGDITVDDSSGGSVVVSLAVVELVVESGLGLGSRLLVIIGGGVVVVLDTGGSEVTGSVPFPGLSGVRMLERMLSIGSSTSLVLVVDAVTTSFVLVVDVVTIPEGANRIPDVLVVVVVGITETGGSDGFVVVVFAAKGGSLLMTTGGLLGSGALDETGSTVEETGIGVVLVVVSVVVSVVEVVGGTTTDGTFADETASEVETAFEVETASEVDGNGSSSDALDEGALELMGSESAFEVEVELVLFTAGVGVGGAGAGATKMVL